MEQTVKIGVLGVYRGRTMIEYCKHDSRVKLAAVCDKRKDALQKMKEELNDESISYYENFEDLLESDVDAIVLANYANEHAPYAVKCLEHGKHVLSEVMPVQNFAEAVALVEAVEKTGKIYDYAENYCYLVAPREMRRLYKSGALGEFEYGEGEYLHNCEAGWHTITYGDPNHWRNNMSAFFYSTHSIGPLIHITGLKPVKVTGFEMPYNNRMARMGAKAGWGSLIIITLENGAVIKSLHGVGPSKNSVWFSVYGSLGTAESRREAAEGDCAIYTDLDEFEGENADRKNKYTPKDEFSERAEAAGHGGSDFFTMWHFVSKILGEENAEIIDVYEALDMFLPSLLAYRSVLAGGVSMDVPNFRNPAEREIYRRDFACTDPKVAGDMLQPSYSKGNPYVPSEVYEKLRKAYLKTL
ncbi:Gfo/Idh/MocA family protein [Pumilibacter intestinalis]|uniref:Gfo/Idh/MocA family protein n=1 Tax=Pumilibacter intestinalis TaxID=2941511 RepID=UPI00203E4974|nr:Gfo/Idh/MocA family oxidoreductase [Pumilibacter intestinalis]